MDLQAHAGVGMVLKGTLMVHLLILADQEDQGQEILTVATVVASLIVAIAGTAVETAIMVTAVIAMTAIPVVTEIAVIEEIETIVVIEMIGVIEMNVEREEVAGVTRIKKIRRRNPQLQLQ